MNFPDDVLNARQRIKNTIRRTPLEYSPELSAKSGARVFIKWENEQITGSFKLRGAVNKVRSLKPEERTAGIVSASTGNHGLAVSTASKIEGLDLILFLPQTASGFKKKKIEAMGVSLVYFGDDCEKTEVHAREFAGVEGRIFISPYNDPAVIAGQGTLGLEIIEDLPDVDDIIVPIGGGGLVAGIAGVVKSLKPGARIHGVEPETSAFMTASVKAGRLVEIEEKPTLAGAVAGGIESGSMTFPLCRDLVDSYLTVSERSIAASMALIDRSHGKALEGAGALATAGLLGDPSRFRGRTVVCLASGGNVDPVEFKAIIG